MPSKALLNAKIWPQLGLDYAPAINQELLLNNACRAELGPQLLLYDQVVIPTTDFGILPILVAWLGMPVLLEAFECRSLKFARYASCLGYAGNGNALSAFIVQRLGTLKFEWWQKAIWGSTQDALGEQLQNSLPAIASTERNKLYDLTLQQTQDFSLSNDDFMRSIATESYRDVMRTPELLTEMQKHYESQSHPEGVDLRWLPEVRADQLRVAGIKAVRDPVDLLLRVGELNFQIRMATEFGEADLYTAEQTAPILKSKLQRSIPSNEVLDGFAKLLKLTSTPNVEAGIASGDITFSEVWAARSSKNGVAFRDWLRASHFTDAEDLAKAYIATMEDVPTVSSLPIKTLRFIATTAADGLLGVVTSAIDSFFVEKWLGGYTPRLFIDEMRRFRIEPK